MSVPTLCKGEGALLKFFKSEGNSQIFFPPLSQFLKQFEEKITKLIKEVFGKEFKKYKDTKIKSTKIISSNFTLTIKGITSLKQEVNDLKESIEFTQNDLEEKVTMVEKKYSRLKSR